MRVVAPHGALDQPVRPVVGVVDDLRVVQPERAQVLQEVVPVGQRQPDLGDPGVPLQHGLAHRVQGLLQGACWAARRRSPPARPGRCRAAPKSAGAAGVPPAGGDRGGQDAVVGLGQRGVAVPREAGEARAGRLQQHQVGEPGQDVLLSDRRR